MNEFLSAILSFPTVVFTVLLGVIVLYWLMVIVGAIGVDVLHVGEAAGGKIEGIVDGAVEGKIEGVVDGAVSGHAEGATGKLEAVGGGGGFLAMLGFGKVPATVVISSLVLWSWALCLLIARSGAEMGLPSWSLQVLAPVLAVFLGGVLTGALVRGIGRFIVHQEPLRRADLVGKLCTITTGRVDANFGQALISEHGVDLTVDVRCDPPNSLRRNAQAVLVAYDSEHHFFTVEAYDQPLATLGERPPAAH
ncbi:MAG TPA: hypothetical protein VGB85_26590 [Nannocystis sp.]|jgi:hypothetical protein